MPRLRITKEKLNYSILNSVSGTSFKKKNIQLLISTKGDEELARRLQEQYGDYIAEHLPVKGEKKPVQESTLSIFFFWVPH